MVPRNARQEALSRAYVRAVAALAGMTCFDLGQDYGIDMCLRMVDQEERRYSDSGDQLDLQLKSTTSAEVTVAEVVHDLEVRAYDVLRKVNVRCPRFLVLLVLPPNEDEWLRHTVEELVIRGCSFWHSLKGAGPTPAHTTTRIRIPRGNVFSVEAVRSLFRGIPEGDR